MGSSRPALKKESLQAKKPISSSAQRKKPRVVVQEVGKVSTEDNAPELKSKLSVAEIQKIVVEHQDLGKRLAWSFLTSWRVRLQQDDVTSVVGAALCEAANRFDPSKNVSFKTFFFYHLRGMLIKEIARIIEDQKLLHFMPQAFNGDLPSQDAQLHSTWALPPVETNNPEKLLERRELQIACSEACNDLDELEREVLVRYYINDEPLIDIANELNYCRCHISRVKTRAIEKVSKVLKGRFGQDRHREIPKETQRQNAANRARICYTGGRGRRKITQNEGRIDLAKRLASRYSRLNREQ